MIEKNIWVWIIVVITFGIVGSTARYAHEAQKNKTKFSLKNWAVSTFVGVTVAVITGLICYHFDITNSLTYAMVAIASISGKELMEAIPELSVALAKRKAGK